MIRISNQIATPPAGGEPAADKALQPSKPEADRKGAPGAPLQALAKRSASSADAASGQLRANAAPPRAALPGLKRESAGAMTLAVRAHDAGRAQAHTHADEAKPQGHELALAFKPSLTPGDAHGADGESHTPEHTHAADAKPHEPEHPHAGEHEEPAFDHEAHLAHHHAQIAAAKAHLDPHKRLSDFMQRLSQHKANVLTKLVGG
ncbi:hypothetical protein FAZ69_26985 [Trinickia terrae]|uniref:Uncharacterized protein n=1 Tax=Trinickia terrae TaxID=2571161 RepID=A0A4U1HPA7_9BURK|nr:hypothetical protein [Trinickia terrae]TKC81617.1 hypothetical protein FAZ69_26985 [Trinickia terrae]